MKYARVDMSDEDELTLREWAAEERRSLKGHLEVLIKTAAANRRVEQEKAA